jgi:ABC-type arginine transport system ATPase subunit
MDQGQIIEHGPVALLEKPETETFKNYMSFIR